MAKVLTIDYETRSPIDLKSCGAYVYAENELTDVIFLAVKEDDAVARVWVAPKFRHLVGTEIGDFELAKLIDEAEEIVAHNSFFEEVVTKFKMPFDIPLRKVRDTMAQCCVCGFPANLENAAKLVSGGKVLKDTEGAALMKKLSSPRKLVKAECLEILKEHPEFGDWENVKKKQKDFLDRVKLPGAKYTREEVDLFLIYHEDPTTFKRFLEYARQDVEVEYYIYKTLPKLSTDEQKVWEMSEAINLRGVQIDVENAAKIEKAVDEFTASECKRALALTGGKVTSMKSPISIKKWLSEKGIDTDSVDKESVKFLLSLDLKPEVREFLEIRQKTGKTSTGKYAAMRTSSASDGRVYGQFIYSGATTGRYSSKGIQLQNLARPVGRKNLVDEKLYPKDYEAEVDENDIKLLASGDIELVREFWKCPITLASDMIRSMFIAKEGHEFICADFSAVEARGLAWLAGQEDSLEGFRKGLDFYKVAAAGIYKIPYEQVDGGGKGSQRQVGKTAVLACIASGTMIPTLVGKKAIEEVTSEDYVFDGSSWVPCDGAIFRGKKKVISILGSYCTPDHEWEVDTNLWQSAESMATLLEESITIGKSLDGELSQKIMSLRDVMCAEERAKFQCGTSSLENQLGVINAQKLKVLSPEQNFVQCQEKQSVDGLTGFTLLLADAILKKILSTKTTEEEALQYVKNGVQIKIPFYHTFVQLRVGGTKTSKWIVSITMGPTNREIYVLCQDQEITAIKELTCLSNTMAIGLQLLLFGLSIVQSMHMPESSQKNSSEASLQKVLFKEFQKTCAESIRNTSILRHCFFAEKKCLWKNFGKSMRLGSLKNVHFKDGLMRVSLWKSLSLEDAPQENTYDLLNCGPNNKFSINTDNGPMVVHNCGYGGGWGAMLRFGADKMGITEEEGREIVKAWRAANSNIVEFWYALRDGSLDAMRFPGDRITVGKVSFRKRGSFLTLRLPSGRDIYYPGAKVEWCDMPWEDKHTGKVAQAKLVTSMTLTPAKLWVRRPLSHVVASENVTQAACRDLLINGVRNVEEAGYPVVVHVHDEAVSEVPEGYGSLKEFETLLAKVPHWADGLPLVAEGWRGKRYRK